MESNIDKAEVIKGLKETVLYIGIVCPWQDGADPSKLMRMGTAVHDAIILLEDKNGKEA